MSSLKCLVLCCAASGVAFSSRSEVVYDNLVKPLGDYLRGFAYQEVADDVVLGGTQRIFESLTVAYAGFNFDGDETLTVTLYAMDGPPTPESFGFNTPGAVLFSATQPIVATDGALVDFLDNTGIVLPDVVGIGLAFGGIEFDPTGAGADGGPLLFHPPAVGSSLDDFWLRGFPSPGEPWGLYDFGGGPRVNLGLQLSARGAAVPDASSGVTLCGLSAVALLGFVRRCRRGV